MMKTDAFAQNRRLGRGVNIIGYDNALWKTGKGRFQNKHFRLIKEAGFNHVRINLHPFKFTDDDHVIAPLWLETLDWAVEQALDNNLVIILDLHEFHAMSKDPMGLKDKFLSVWEQLATRYKDCPDTVFFEILNEPHDKLTVELRRYPLEYTILRR
jgi:endoglucanase